MRSSAIKILFPVLFLFLSACGPAAHPPEPDNLFWPLPPERPRIKYIQSIYSEDDIGRVYSLKEKLFGKDYNDRMSRPYGVFARDGKIVVSDISLWNVFVFDLNTKRLMTVGGERAFQLPSAAVLDASGNIYVADPDAGKIAVYNARGKYVTAYLLKGCRPVALAMNESLGRLYVVDNAVDRVVVLRLSDGEKLFEFGGRGKNDGQFNMPIDVAVDKQGAVYVLDSGNFRVQIFDADGRFLRSFGAPGDGPGFFARPKGIAIDSEKHIYVTDAAFNNFQIFDSEGRPLMFVGSLGPWPGQLNLPAGISIDEHDRIYIADQLNGRIEVFQYLGKNNGPSH